MFGSRSSRRRSWLPTPLALHPSTPRPASRMWQRYLAEAEPAARAIEQQASKRIWEFYYLAQYYRAVEDGRKELELFRQVPPDCWTDHFTTFYLARVEALGEKPDDGVVERIKRGECGSVAALGLAYLLALEGRTQESKGLSAQWGEESTWMEAALACTDVYDLCGEPQKGDAIGGEATEAFPESGTWHARWLGAGLSPPLSGGADERRATPDRGRAIQREEKVVDVRPLESRHEVSRRGRGAQSERTPSQV